MKGLKKDLEKIYKLDPDNFKAKKCLGLLYLSQEKLPEAKTVLESALETCPGDPDVLNNLGLVYLKSGPVTRAGEFFRKALVKCPNHFDTLFNLGRFLEKTGLCRQGPGTLSGPVEKIPRQPGRSERNCPACLAGIRGGIQRMNPRALP